MAESPREILLQGVATLLRGMTGTRFFGTAYANAPTVELLDQPPGTVNKFPHLAVFEEAGSETLAADDDGGEDDDFRFDIYGHMDSTAALSARQWSGRLLHDTKRTVRAATRGSGALRLLGCAWVLFGPETREYDQAMGRFILPCTARLNYMLAAY